MNIAVHAATWWLRAADPLGPSDVNPDDARDRACEVTSTRRICNPSAPEPPPSDAPDVPNPGAGAGLFGQALVVLLVAALVVAVAWLVMRWLSGEGSGTERGDDDEISDVDEAIDEQVDARVIDRETPPDRWRRHAGEARARGDFREAVRCQYRGLVGDLARAGFVDEIPGRTSGEERAQVAEIAPRLGASGDEVSAWFDRTADLFDAAWFDDDEVSADDDQRFLAAERPVLDAVLSNAGRRAARS
ncbi:MAG: hypothetical protein AB8G14_17680 [Ilumatobacter sp.]